MNGKLKQYRVTKYDPANRVNGEYTKDEWTSMYDVGRSYNGKVFTFEEYLKVEKSYLDVIEDVLKELDIKAVEVRQGERIFSALNNSAVNSCEEVLMIARAFCEKIFGASSRRETSLFTSDMITICI